MTAHLLDTTITLAGMRSGMDAPTTQDSVDIEAIWSTGRLAELPASCREALGPETRIRTVQTGEFVYWDGPTLYVVISGCVCIFLGSRGRRAALRYVPAGEMLGLPTMIAPDVTASAGLELLIRAVEPTRLARLPAENFARLVRRDAEASWAVSRWLVEDMVAGHTVLADDVFLPVRQLLARHMLDLAHRDGGETVVTATQEQLADAIGSVRAVVARALGEMRRMNLIARDSRGIVITDLPEMHRLARGDAE